MVRQRRGDWVRKELGGSQGGVGGTRRVGGHQVDGGGVVLFAGRTGLGWGRNWAKCTAVSSHPQASAGSLPHFGYWSVSRSRPDFPLPSAPLPS